MSFTDLHCHLLPGIDDGPRNWQTTLAMARLAVAEGIRTIVATPHQLGRYEVKLYVSPVGEILRAEFPERVVLINEALVALNDLRNVGQRFDASPQRRQPIRRH